MKRILIIDDDIVIRKMLADLINKNQLGYVVGELADGYHAVGEIEFYKPDIVLVDLLLPGNDGISIVKESLESGFNGKFVMISQVEEQYMISKAYESGCVFFLSKPINLVEAVSILRTVCQTLDLERSLQAIRNTVTNMPSSTNKMPMSFSSVKNASPETQLDTIFTELGIISETGVEELRTLLLQILKLKKENPMASYRLQDYYIKIADDKTKNGMSNINARSVEQRIRRVIIKAMTTIAEVGHEDFYNPKFSEYSSTLFELSQVKQEIRYIEHETSVRGKINAKRFVEGIISKVRI